MRTKSIQKQTILEVACSVVKTEGISKATARYIAKKGGFSTTPIYANFESTKQLLSSVRKKIVKELMTELTKTVNTPTREEVVTFFAEYGRKNPGIIESFIFDHTFAIKMSKQVTSALKQNFCLTKDEFYILMLIACAFALSNVTSEKIITTVNKMF